MNNVTKLNLTPDQPGGADGGPWFWLAFPLIAAVGFFWERRRQESKDMAILLNDVEQKLMIRQAIFCSYVESRDGRKNIEQDLMDIASKNPMAKLKMKHGLRDIFENDKHCAELWNKDMKNNGKLMWDYLKNWKEKAGLENK